MKRATFGERWWDLKKLDAQDARINEKLREQVIYVTILILHVSKYFKSCNFFVINWDSEIN
jgi:hypothetical protein